MTERVPAGQALKGWKVLLDRAAAGERIVITRDGKDVAMLGPAPVARPTQLRPVGGGARFDNAAVRDLLSKVNRKPKS